MVSARQSLEERVSHVERELEELKARIAQRKPERWWEQIVGDFEGDKSFVEIVRLGRETRRASEDSN